MRVLVADDDRASLQVLSHLLGQWGMDIVACNAGDVAERLLLDPNGPTLAILDWEMPGRCGPDICRSLRQKLGDERYVYVIMLTARTSTGDTVEALDSGADDYVTKPVSPRELRSRLLTGKRVLSLMDELRQARNALQHQATHDMLTGIYNRAGLEASVTREFARAERASEPVSVLLFDVDHFKKVNDNYGHAAGDDVLRELAARVSHTIRPYDVLARYGGEEFLIFAPGIHLDEAALMGERIREVVESTPFHTRAGMLPITVSVGVGSSLADTEGRLDPLIESADRALYRAKGRGRNMVCTAGETPMPGTMAPVQVDRSPSAGFDSPRDESATPESPLTAVPSLASAALSDDDARAPTIEMRASDMTADNGALGDQVYDHLRDMLEDAVDTDGPALISAYLDMAKTDIGKIEDATRVESWADVKRAAHSLKGSSANFNVEPLRHLAELVEHDPGCASEQLTAMHNVFPLVVRALATRFGLPENDLMVHSATG